MQKNTLIHIGKCGGSTCREAILKSKVFIDEVVHIHQPVIDQCTKYFIIARNPISRSISAFNWRRYLVQNDPWQKERFPGEYSILMHYRNINSLAESLYFKDGTSNVLAQGNFRSIHHLGESISFYLSKLLKKIRPDQIGGVIMQETLDDDLLRVFGVSTSLQERRYIDKSTPEMLHLSEERLNNLRIFLKSDFTCLNILRSYGKINGKAKF